MAEFVRVRDKSTGYHLSIPAHRFDSALYAKVSGESALDRHGDPAEPNYHPKPTKKAASKRTTRARKATTSPGKQDGQQTADTTEEDN